MLLILCEYGSSNLVRGPLIVIWLLLIDITGVIMMTTQLLSLVLRKLRQPRVIAEVIGGIFLGACMIIVAQMVMLTVY